MGKKMLIAFGLGFVIEFFGIFVLLGYAVTTEVPIYASEKIKTFLLLFVVFFVAILVMECYLNTPAREVAVDVVAIIIILFFFLKKKDNSWFGPSNNVFQIMKECIIPSLIINAFAAFVSQIIMLPGSKKQETNPEE